MNESGFGLLTEGLITKGLTEWKSHIPCGLMNESRFGLLNEGVITKGLAERKSHMYAIWPKQLKFLRREENRFCSVLFCSVVIMKVKLLSHRLNSCFLPKTNVKKISCIV